MVGRGLWRKIKLGKGSECGGERDWEHLSVFLGMVKEGLSEKEASEQRPKGCEEEKSGHLAPSPRGLWGRTESWAGVSMA